MNWNKLQNEQCPKYECDKSKEYSQFEDKHEDLTYNKQIRAYHCNVCGYSIYADTMIKFIAGRTKNQKGKTYKFLEKEKTENKTTSTSYYFAKNGEYPLTSY